MNREEAHRIHDMGWRWFQLLAQQRMQLVSFWLVAMSFLSTGAIVAYSEEQYAATILVLGAVIGATFVFWFFDLRTQELLSRGEDLMAQAESDLQESYGDSNLRLVQGMHGGGRVTYRRLFAALYWGAMALAAFGIAAAIISL